MKIKPMYVIVSLVLVLIFIWSFAVLTNLIDFEKNKIFEKGLTSRVIADLDTKLSGNDNYEFINLLHWGKNNLTYKFENFNDCNSKLNKRIKLAFEKLNQEMRGELSFKEVYSESADISIYCKPYKSELNYGLAGDFSHSVVTYGDASFDVSNENENLIIHGDINFYGSGLVCLTDYPAVEVHEILHSFGLAHDYSVNSIMRAEVEQTSNDCKVKSIDKKFISCLGEIYSSSSLSDWDENACSNINFIDFNNVSCSEGWYPVKGSRFCCPKPNMNIVDGYCY